MPVDPGDLQDVLLTLDPMRVEEFVYDLITSLPEFANVVLGLSLDKGIGADIAAEHMPDREQWIFEVKRVPILGSMHVDRFYPIAEAARALRRTKCVLVTPGIAPRNIRDSAQRRDIEIWDKNELSQRVTPALLDRYRAPGAATPAARRSAVESSTVHGKASSLKTRFATIAAGKKQWPDFQRLVADTFEFLFVPPLGVPDYESADEERRNRRDFVMENAAEHGVWAALRIRYSADYIAVDSKNSDRITKKEVVLTAHYLKPYGLGMLAFVVSRGKPGDSAVHAVREQWIAGGKLIVILNDADMLKMIELRAQGAVAEDHIRALVADFRKSL